MKREQPTTDQATRATRGKVLIDSQDALVDAVFSSSCGGHTEANHHVWGGKAKSYLGGVSDLRENHQGITPKETHAWVKHASPFVLHQPSLLLGKVFFVGSASLVRPSFGSSRAKLSRS